MKQNSKQENESTISREAESWLEVVRMIHIYGSDELNWWGRREATNL